MLDPVIKFSLAPEPLALEPKCREAVVQSPFCGSPRADQSAVYFKLFRKRAVQRAQTAFKVIAREADFHVRTKADNVDALHRRRLDLRKGFLSSALAQFSDRGERHIITL